MSRLNKANEIIELAILFQNSYTGLAIEDIQEKFECSRRSAERMKTVLFDMFPDKIEEMPSIGDKKKRWRFVKGTMNALITFSADDFANLEYLKNLANNEDKQKEIDELIAKIKALAPQKNMLTLDTDISALLEVEALAVRQYSAFKMDLQTMQKIRTALLAFKKVRFDYFYENDFHSITLCPYGVIIGNKYYLIGVEQEKIKYYRIDKMKDFKVLDEYFERDEDFNLKKYAQNSFGIYNDKPVDVELLFSDRVAEDVKNYHFHPSQKIKEKPTGDVVVKFSASGEFEIINELFKWRDSVEIIKPQSLKKAYKNELQKMIKNAI